MKLTSRLGIAVLATTLPVAPGNVAPSPTEARVALVIGNAAYPEFPLVNPVHDAQAMGRTLKAAGFEVFERLDATKESMAAGLAEAVSRMSGRQATAVFYYAGHGIQIDWRNFLIPVNARPRNASEAQTMTLDLGQVIEAFRKAGTRRNILVLDACRNNPFRALTEAKGLAQMDAPPGTLLAYATAPGHVADDGVKGNGLYTGNLLEELGRDAKIEDVFKRVRLKVRQQSAGRQIPWESTSLEDDFFLRAPGAKPAATEVERDQRLEREHAEWEEALKLSTPEALIGYLTQHPSGPFSELAQFRLDQVQKVQVLPQVKPGSPTVLSSGINRFRVGDVLEYRETWNAPMHMDGRVVYEVQRAGDDQVEVKVSYLGRDGRVKTTKTQLWDQLGNLLSYNDGTRRSLPWVQVPADLSLGKHWVSEFWVLPEAGSTHQRMRISWNLKVTGREQMQHGGRDLLTFRVEGTSTSSLKSPGGTVYWVDPGTFIKLQESTWRENAAGLRVVDYHRELLAYRPAKP